jgi:outer membrane protein OmpA-like peptidoglycan-associated protein
VPTPSSDLPSRCTGAPALTLGYPRPHTVTALLNSDVVFQLSSAALQPAAAAALHGLLGPVTNAQTVSVDGYTDSTGGDRINIPLSRARAATVASWIEQHAGIPANRVHARGLGSSNPVANNATAAGRALNRRVLIVVREN